jgi:hypothetical protein
MQLRPRPPAPSNPAYLKWKDTREQDITDFMGSLMEMTTVVPDQLFLNTWDLIAAIFRQLTTIFSNFRDTANDCEVFSQFLLDFGLCHILSVTPSQLRPDMGQGGKHHHLDFDIKGRVARRNATVCA